MKSTNNSATANPPAANAADDLHTIIDLLAERAEIKHRLTEQSQFVELAMFAAARTNCHEHVDLSQRQGQIEAQVEEITRKHPEWFAESKSIPTPFGTVKLTQSTSLDLVSDEETVLARVGTHFGKQSGDYIRSEISLNLEALEDLDDTTLKQLGLKRKTEDLFSIAAAKVQTAAAFKAAARSIAPVKEVRK